MLYTIKRQPEDISAYKFDTEFSPEALAEGWQELETACIADYPWLADYPDNFPAFAKVGWNKNGINVLMYAKEAPVLAENRGWEGMPCQDSCLEFFFKPFPEQDERYFNFEVNPVGAVCAMTGEGRPNRARFTRPIEGMSVNTVVSGEWWAVSYNIPVALVKQCFGSELTVGCILRGNFYKCSEKIHKHFGTWAHVVAPRPDFHRPECFEELVLE